MKITMLTKVDYAGSGHKLYKAIKTHTDHDIDFYSEPGRNVFNIKDYGGKNILTADKNELQQRIEESDIIHLKSGWLATEYENWYGIKITHKPLAQTFSSGFERRYDPITRTGKARYDAEKDYKNVTIRTSFEPDLLYPGYKGVLTPFPVDSMDKKIEWKLSDPPIFTHNPSSERSKRTNFIKKVFTHFPEMEIRVTRGKARMPQAQSIAKRKEATIFFDQFAVGAYGNAACEAMQYGIPVCAWISPAAFSYVPDWYKEECPVITTDNIVVEEWVELIKKTMTGDMEELSKKTKAWCDKMHSYQAVAKQWDKLYQSI